MKSGAVFLLNVALSFYLPISDWVISVARWVEALEIVRQ